MGLLIFGWAVSLTSYAWIRLFDWVINPWLRKRARAKLGITRKGLTDEQIQAILRDFAAFAKQKKEADQSAAIRDAEIAATLNRIRRAGA